MRIDIRRERYTVEGWEPMSPLVLHTMPQAALALARERSDGPIAPTDAEIETACVQTYRRSNGAPTYGDVTVTRVAIDRAS